MNRQTIPAPDECFWVEPPTWPPVFACYHPASDDQWQMWGAGETRDEAYEEMLSQHAEWIATGMPEQRHEFDGETPRNYAEQRGL